MKGINIKVVVERDGEVVSYQHAFLPFNSISSITYTPRSIRTMADEYIGLYMLIGNTRMFKKHELHEDSWLLLKSIAQRGYHGNNSDSNTES